MDEHSRPAAETTEEQDRRQVETFTLREDRDRALALARDIVERVTRPGASIPSATMRGWQHRLRQLERAAEEEL